MTNHALNYRRALPLGVVFGLASLAAIVTFLYYTSEWALNTGEDPHGITQFNRYLKAQYSYYAGVISLLTLIVFFSGYHLTRIR